MNPIKILSLFLLAIIFSLYSPSSVCAQQKNLFLYNLHTHEKFQGPYTKKDGTYDKKQLKEINRVLRDHRTNEIHQIDPCLLDLLYDLAGSIRIDVISGYRSPKSNLMLHQKDKGVSKNSLHTVGRAIDIAIPGVPLKTLRDKAKALKRGGVGYYPNNHFIHVDTGRVRCWGAQK